MLGTLAGLFRVGPCDVFPRQRPEVTKTLKGGSLSGEVMTTKVQGPGEGITGHSPQGEQRQLGDLAWTPRGIC